MCIYRIVCLNFAGKIHMNNMFECLTLMFSILLIRSLSKSCDYFLIFFINNFSVPNIHTKKIVIFLFDEPLMGKFDGYEPLKPREGGGGGLDIQPIVVEPLKKFKKMCVS